MVVKLQQHKSTRDDPNAMLPVRPILPGDAFPLSLHILALGGNHLPFAGTPSGER